MATDKRKRAIRALAAERGISYTAAMRLHDANAAPAGPTSFCVAGERMPIDDPLLLSADTGAGALLLAVSIFLTAAKEGAEVVILGANSFLAPRSHLVNEPSPGGIAEASAEFPGQSRHAQKLIDYLNSEFTRRMTVVAESDERGWRDLSQAVRKQKRIDHPILVVEVAGDGTETDEGAPYKIAVLERMRMTCQRLRRQGRAAGFASLSVHVGDRGRTLVDQVQGKEFARAIMGRIQGADKGTVSVVDAFVNGADREGYLDALPTLGAGQFLILSSSHGADVRQADLEPYLHLFDGNPRKARAYHASTSRPSHPDPER